MVGRTNAGGSGGVKGMPQFTYTGTYSLIDDGDKNWRIKFLTSGTLTFSKLGTGNGMIDIFCVGGGGGPYRSLDSRGYWHMGSGGGGRCHCVTNNTILKDTEYSIVVGDGGAHGTSGGSSSFGTLCSVSGGDCGGDNVDGSGGSGGGDTGGTDGANGTGGTVGHGQGTFAELGYYVCREFWEESGTRYSDGGGNNITSLTDNSGNGGKPDIWEQYIVGSSGIVVIRNHR